MEGFWIIQLKWKGGGRHLENGVIILMNGEVFGGDSLFVYEGTYTQHGNKLEADVDVKQCVAEGAMPLQLTSRNNYELKITGTLQDDKGKISVHGVNVGGTESFSGWLTKKRDLPARSQGFVEKR
jgi:hypothetical protein